jgi:hypothetical protein
MLFERLVLILILVVAFVLAMYYLPRNLQSYSDMSTFKLLVLIFIASEALSLIMICLEIGSGMPGLALGAVGGAGLVRAMHQRD